MAPADLTPDLKLWCRDCRTGPLAVHVARERRANVSPPFVNCGLQCTVIIVWEERSNGRPESTYGSEHSRLRSLGYTDFVSRIVSGVDDKTGGLAAARSI
jgi:hypothetical protein